MKKIILLVLTCTTAFTSCKKENSNNTLQKDNNILAIEDAKWLNGRWENQTGEGHISEIWKTENDTLMLGSMFFVVNNDTVFSETIRLENNDNKLCYTVQHGINPEDKPVSFELIEKTGNSMTFENKENDYPTHISYKKISHDSLVASISGNIEGKFKEEFFPMKRTK